MICYNEGCPCAQSFRAFISLFLMPFCGANKYCTSTKFITEEIKLPKVM